MSILFSILDVLSMSGAPNPPGFGTGIPGSAGPPLMDGGPGGPDQEKGDGAENPDDSGPPGPPPPGPPPPEPPPPPPGEDDEGCD